MAHARQGLHCRCRTVTVTVLESPEYKVRSGDEALLGEPLAPRTIWVTAGDDLEAELIATERDTGADDVLGTSTRTHRAADGWDLGEHEVRAPGGASPPSGAWTAPTVRACA